MKVTSDNKPAIFAPVGNGSYLYRFNIEEVEIKGMDTVTKQWQYDEVTVWAPISANKITESVMNKLWNKDVEQKMLNDYNAAQLGILGEEYIQKYKDFLGERKVVKEQIDEDFSAFTLIQ